MTIDAYFPYIAASYIITAGLLSIIILSTVIRYRRSHISRDEG